MFFSPFPIIDILGSSARQTHGTAQPQVGCFLMFFSIIQYYSHLPHRVDLRFFVS